MSACEWDAVVVGSGFGGAVTAYRLARAGLRVCVLERGKKWPPNSFARSPMEMRNNFWNPSNGLYGLFNVWSFRGSAALVASGLGGGSLIYANVLIRKDAEWFDDAWPIKRADLDPHYDQVENMLNVQQYPVHVPPFHRTDKTHAIQHAARQLGHQIVPLNLAVSFRKKPVLDPAKPDDINNPAVIAEPIEETNPNLHNMSRYTCRLCGECDIGCNYGSKNTLDFNYLSEAERLGAVIHHLSEVETFAPLPGGGYEVTYLKHDAANREGKRLSKEQKDARERVTITCDKLVLAGGTMGTTFLLMSNRSNFPKLSSALGTKYSTNGDDLAFFVDAKKPLRPDFGPVITTGVRFPDSLDGTGDVGRGFYLEDGGNPYLLSWVVELAGVFALARRFFRFVLLRLRFLLGLSHTTDMGWQLSKLIGKCKRSSHAMPVLVMGRDIPSGNFTLKNGVLDCDWSIRPSRSYYDRVSRELEKMAHAMDAKYTPNPIFRWNFQQVLTAHPLGGCPMGRNAEEGVVNSWGEVFGYPGLYVADGSAMPGPVGPNPSLTIAAFADRVAEGILATHKPSRTIAQPIASTINGRDRTVNTTVEFSEQMKGLVAFGESDYALGERNGEPLTLELRIRTEDIDLFLADPKHRGSVEGYVICSQFGSDKLPIEQGEFQCLVNGTGNSRHFHYRLVFRDDRKYRHTLQGTKNICHDGFENLWRDCSTLFTKVFASDVGGEQFDTAVPEAAGILHIHVLDFVKEMTTFRANADSVITALEAEEKFGRFFIGTLWDVYKPSSGAICSHEGKRRIPLFTLRGVKDADISTHYIQTLDHIGLTLFRFNRRPCRDVVVLLHGLTTSTDMFVMPEHYNIVNYLLDHDFTDVWSFDWRGSMRYSYDLFPSDFTMDDIALYDMPAAFAHIREQVGPEARIHVICHCIGSLTFMMSFYAGLIDGITSVISNSVSLTPIVSTWCKWKLTFAPIIFFRATPLNPRWRLSPGLLPYGKWFSKWISFCHPKCNVPACHMVSFMWGSGDPAAWVHKNLDEITHERTGDLFGAVNIRYYKHVRKMASRQRAIKMYPQNPRYNRLPNDYLEHADRIDTPILFVSGKKNGIFEKSNELTYETLNQLKPGNENKCKVFEGYGHQDIFMGKNCDKDIFPTFVDFLQQQSVAPQHRA